MCLFKISIQFNKITIKATIYLAEYVSLYNPLTALLSKQVDVKIHEKCFLKKSDSLCSHIFVHKWEHYTGVGNDIVIIRTSSNAIRI